MKPKTGTTKGRARIRCTLRSLISLNHRRVTWLEEPRLPHLFRLLQIEEELLTLNTASVAGQTTISTNNAVTRNHNRNLIAADRLAHSLRRSTGTNRTRNLAVSGGVPGRNSLQMLPHNQLKIGALRI